MAYDKLESYYTRLKENEERLERIHATLEGQFRKYTEDRETIELAARSLGYYDENETRVYIEGYDYKRPFYLVGRSVGEYRPVDANPAVFRIVAVLVGIITYIAVRYRRRNDRFTR